MCYLTKFYYSLDVDAVVVLVDSAELDLLSIIPSGIPMAANAHMTMTTLRIIQII
jgi:hypothetical protein